MYKISVESDGDFHNVVIGDRYTPFAFEAKDLLKTFLKQGCRVEAYKLVRNTGFVFVWTFWDKRDEIEEEIEE